MGLRGPQAQPISAHRRRHSRTFRNSLVQGVDETTDIDRPRTAIRDLRRKCQELLPGYDPWAAAVSYHFDLKCATAAVRFFHCELSHVKGELAGQAFKLQRWQQAVVGNLYGWVDDDGLRRYRESLIYVPRGNGKTTLAAGLILYGLFKDDEPGAEIYGCASEYKQASLVFEHARGMVLANPRLAARATICGTGPATQTRAIQLGQETGFSTYRVICSKSDPAHGFNTHLVVVDELHTQPDRNLVDALMTSTGKRRQPLVIYITTADFDRPSICNVKYDHAKRVIRDPALDPSFLPVIFEAAADADWRSPKVWKKSNPNLGVSLKRDFLKRECKRADEEPTYENTFKRLHLNMRTTQEMKWIDVEKWDQCRRQFDPEILKGNECWGGLDLGATSDLTALCLLFPDEDSDAVRAIWWFWAPRVKAEKRERVDRVPYETWARQGWIRLTDGDEIDYALIRRDINDIAQSYTITDLAADRLFQGAQLCQELIADGFKVIPFGQGFTSMAAPSVEFERMVNAGKFLHRGSPLMRWQIDGVAVKMDAAGNIKPDKGDIKGAVRRVVKIDGVVAAIMGLGRYTNREQFRSVYEDRGLMVIG